MLRKPRTDEPDENIPNESVAEPHLSQKEGSAFSGIRKPPSDHLDRFLNVLIGGLSLLVVALAVSLVFRLSSSSPETPKTETIAVTENTENTVNTEEDQNIIKSHTLRVEVLNGTEVPRLAAKMADFLRSKGYDVVQTGNAKHANFRKTVVQDRIGNISGAQQVARILGVHESNVLQQKNPQLYLDVTVIIGQDYKSLKFLNP